MHENYVFVQVDFVVVQRAPSGSSTRWCPTRRWTRRSRKTCRRRKSGRPRSFCSRRPAPRSLGTRSTWTTGCTPWASPSTRPKSRTCSLRRLQRRASSEPEVLYFKWFVLIAFDVGVGGHVQCSWGYFLLPVCSMSIKSKELRSDKIDL